METPRTRYVRSGELAIAYQVHGAGDHDLLFSGGTASNVDTVWRIPEAARLFERLGRFARVIRYDRRDTGLSDPIRDDLTLEAHAADALAVLDRTSARRPVLVGSLDGSRSLALLAATHPDRVGGLIALAPSARGTATSTPAFAETAARTITDIESYPDGMVTIYAPGAATDPVLHARLARFIQSAVTPRQAERLLRLSLTSDVSGALPLVQAPTLILRARDLRMPPAEAVREFAALIPGAEYREIPGDAAFTYALDVEMLADIIEEFVTGNAPAPVTSRVLATVLFTDLVGSTELAAQAGDTAWVETLERHLHGAGTLVAEHGGELVKSTGDGVLALFAGPAQGVRCAERIIDDARGLGLQVRTGLHTGEVERTGGDVSGIAVHLAARIMGLADGGEVLVSRTVRDLVIGSRLRFTDHGEHELKGIPDRWALYSVM